MKIKTIKTRKLVKGIKILNKSSALSARMKKAYLRTKKLTEETRKPRNNSPTEYANDNIQETAQGIVYSLPKSLIKARRNFKRAKRHFQEIKRQLPKERQRAAQQAQKAAHNAQTNAEQLKKNANQAKDTAQGAKDAVDNAKQALKEIRQIVSNDANPLNQARYYRITKVKSTKTHNLSKVKMNRLHSAVSDIVPQNGNRLSLKTEKSNLIQSKIIPKCEPIPAKVSNIKTQNTGIPPNNQLNVNPVRSNVIPSKSQSLTNGQPSKAKPTINKLLNPPANNITKNGVSRTNYTNKGVGNPKIESNFIKIKPTTNRFKGTPTGTIKTAKRSIKTAERTAIKAVKTAQHTARATQQMAKTAVKSAKVAEKTARTAAKTSAKTTKAATKIMIAMTKAAIAAVKGLIALIAAGGGVAVAAILIICMIAMLVSSAFGIFFSSEAAPDTGITINDVMAEIDTEYANKITDIINSNSHDTLNMSGTRAGWKQVLAVYAIKTAKDPDNPMEVAIIDDEKAEILRTVFWDMNTVSHRTERVRHRETYTDEDGNTKTETWYERILHVTRTHKTTDEMAAHYDFTADQKEWLAELLQPEYNGLWNTLLYGINSVGSSAMIDVAITQLGNVGGEIYWKWYGFDSRVAWCACFVSWVADQLGFIEAEIIPRFSWCDDGIQWFKARGQWQNRGYTPAPGDIIFFDWNGDGVSDHVGIVEFVEGDTVHTIEGNTSDSVDRRSYRLNNSTIMGYGVPLY